MRWSKEGDVYRLIDKHSFTRALMYFEIQYHCIGPLGTSAPIIETSSSNRRILGRLMVKRLKELGYTK